MGLRPNKPGTFKPDESKDVIDLSNPAKEPGRKNSKKENPKGK